MGVGLVEDPPSRGGLAGGGTYGEDQGPGHGAMSCWAAGPSGARTSWGSTSSSRLGGGSGFAMRCRRIGRPRGRMRCRGNGSSLPRGADGRERGIFSCTWGGGFLQPVSLGALGKRGSLKNTFASFRPSLGGHDEDLGARALGMQLESTRLYHRPPPSPGLGMVRRSRATIDVRPIAARLRSGVMASYGHSAGFPADHFHGRHA